MCYKMSDVRLSNASPTLERVDARQPDNLRPPVRRNLFGRPDPEEIQRNLAAVVQEDVQAFRERYNFDPVNDTPLASRNYEWQQDSNPPEYYVRPAHGSQRTRRGTDLPGDDSRHGAEEEGERRRDRQPDRDGSRKRRSGASGSCSSECQSKKSHTDEDDDDDDQSKGAGAPVKNSAREGRPVAGGIL